VKNMVYEDCDLEIAQNIKRHNSEIAEERDQVLTFKGKHGILKKKMGQMVKKEEENEQRMQEMKEEQRECKEKIESLEKEKRHKDVEIRERDEQISEKEKRIYDIKKKNQELEKFKFVLDYKIVELRKQLEPKNLEIETMKETIKDMDKELERYNTLNQAYKLSNDNQELKIEALQKEMKEIKNRLEESESMNNRFRTDLEETVQYIQDYKMLKAGVKLLYQRHCAEPPNSKTLDEDVQREYSRQRDYLERSIGNLKKQISKDQALHRYESTRFMKENASLIKEINDLRREVKMLQMKESKADQRPSARVGGGPSRRPQTAGSRRTTGSGVMGGGIAPTRPSTAVTRKGNEASPGRVINDEVEMLHNEIRRLAERNAELETRANHAEIALGKERAAKTAAADAQNHASALAALSQDLDTIAESP